MTTATAIALARALWPAVTTTAAPDALLEAWYPWATSLAGAVYFGDFQELAVAHLLAHAAYRSDPTGELSGGAEAGVGVVQSMTTSRRSVSWGAVAGSTEASLVDGDLLTTRPGLAYLTLRDSRIDRMPVVL